MNQNAGRLRRRWVDRDRLRWPGCLWGTFDEPLGMRHERRVERRLPDGEDLADPTVVHRCRRQIREPGMMMLVVVPGEELAQARALLVGRKRSGNSGRYFRVLNWLSENGLSLETWGRLWVLVTPRSPAAAPRAWRSWRCRGRRAGSAARGDPSFSQVSRISAGPGSGSPGGPASSRRRSG